MTTILACPRSGFIAADTQMSNTKTKSHCEKIVRIGGALVAMAGTVGFEPVFYEWVAAGEQGRTPKGDYSALVLREGRLLEWFPNDPYPVVRRGPWGIGTGGPMALAAYLAGATARKAVQIASKIDLHSGGPVRIRFV